MTEGSTEGNGPARHLPDSLGHNEETRAEISSLRATIAGRMEEVGAEDGDLITLSTLDGRSMTVAADMRPVLGGQKKVKRFSISRRPKGPALERVYTAKLPVAPTTPARELMIRPGFLMGFKTVMTSHGGYTFPVNDPLDGTELRRTVDEATQILTNPLTVTRGDDALLASEQLQPCDTVHGQEARDVYEAIAPIFSESLDPDPRFFQDATSWRTLYPIYRDQVSPELAIRSVHVLQAPNPGVSEPDAEPATVYTTFNFSGNPFGDGNRFSASVISTHDETGALLNAEMSYLQDLPGDTSRLPATTPLPLDPAERMRVADAIQRQVIPANLTSTPPNAR